MALSIWTLSYGEQVPGRFYVNEGLRQLLFDELKHAGNYDGGGFLPAIRQVSSLRDRL